MTVHLTERDRRMLAKCAVCRWLTTDALSRLYFPGVTLNAVQKRLRKLAEGGYLWSYRAHPTAEAIHTLGPKGRPIVEAQGIEAVLQGEVPKQLAHLLGVNEIRIAVETGPVPVIFFFSAAELRGEGWTHPVIPDAVFAVKAPERRTFFAEYDRSTEILEKLIEKFVRYGRGLNGVPFEAVLLVTERTRRLEILRRKLEKKGVSITILASTLEEIRERGFFEHCFVDLLSGEKRMVLERSPEDEG